MSDPLDDESQSLRGLRAHWPLIVAAVGIAAIGLEWFGVQALGIPGQFTTVAAAIPSAAASPAASSTPTPTPTPSASAPASVPALVGHFSADPSLPDAVVLPADMWQKTGPGWVLATYAPSVKASTRFAADVTEYVGPQVIYLIAPDGTRYQVLEMDPSVPIHLQSWSAGEAYAYIDACAGSACPAGTKSTARLDLTTGTISSLGALGSGSSVFATLPGSVRVWSAAGDNGFVEHNGVSHAFEGGWSPSAISPTSEYVSLRSQVPGDGVSSKGAAAIASTTTGDLIALPDVDPALSCFPGEWTDPTHVLIGCWGDDHVGHQYLADAETGASVIVETAVTAIGTFAPSVEKAFWIEPGVWAGAYAANSDERAYSPSFGGSTAGLSDQGTPSPIPLIDAHGAPIAYATVGAAVDHTLFVEGCAQSTTGGLAPTALVSYDLRTGNERVLLPDPPGGPVANTVPSADAVLTAITSWVVAP